MVSGDFDHITLSDLNDGTEYKATAYEYFKSPDGQRIYYLRDQPSSVTFTTKITRKAQTITFNPPGDQQEGPGPMYFSAGTDAFLPLTFEIITGDVTLTVSGLTDLHPGPVKIKALQPGNEYYLPAEPKEVSFCVIPVKPFISGTRSLLGDVLTSTSATNNQWMLNGEDIPGATGSTYTPAVDGEYTVRVDFSGCSNVSDVLEFLVSPPKPTQTSTDLQVVNITENEATVTLQKGNGMGRVIIVEETDHAGIVPDFNGFYEGTEYAKVFAGDIDHVTVTGLKYRTSYQAFTYEYNISNDGLRISYLTYQTQSVTFLTLGTQVNQTITFTSPGDIPEDSPVIDLYASTTSDLAITFEVIAGNVTLDGEKLTVVGPGPVKIKASQGGNVLFLPAEKEITFCVNPRKPEINVTVANHATTFISSRETNNRWLLNDEEIRNATSQTYAPTEDGLYSVKVDYYGCSSVSDPEEFVAPPTDEPTQASSNLQASNITQTGATLSLTKGNGNGRVIITRKSSTSELIPVDNSVISSSATAIVKTGDITVATLTNLDPNSEYIATAYEYFTAPGEIDYLTSAKAELTFTTLPDVVNGIKESSDQIILYPNPATTSITIDGAPGIDNVTLIDVLGREFKMQIHSNTVDISKLGRGYYIVNIQTTYGPVKRRLLIN